MAYIKSHENVENDCDLQNLVTSILLRFQTPSSKDELFSIINNYLSGSIYHNDINTIKQKLDETLDILLRNEELICSNGIYTQQPL